MPTALAASRDYSRGWYTGGSRIARSIVQGADPGPSQFGASDYSPAAGIVKLAHAILAHGSQRKAREAMAEVEAQQQEKAGLEMEALRQRTDPNYMTAFQRASVANQDADNARLENPPPKTATPKTTFRPGESLARFYGLDPNREYSKEEIDVERDRVNAVERAAHNKEVLKRDAAKTSRRLAAVETIKQLDADAVRAGDVAEAELRTRLESMKQAVLTGKGVPSDSIKVWKKTIGYNKNTGSVPPGAWAGRIANIRLQVEENFKRQNAAKRRLAQQIIESEMGACPDLMTDTQGGSSTPDYEEQ